MSRTRATGLGTSGPTISAIRYDDSGGVGAKLMRRAPRPSPSSSAGAGCSRSTVRPAGTPRNGQLPGGLERRLVEAGEQASGVGGLELGDRQRPGAVKPPQAGAEDAAVADHQPGHAGGQRFPELQRDGLALAIGAGLSGDAPPPRQLDLGRQQVQSDSVEVQRDRAAPPASGRWSAAPRSCRRAGRGAGRLRSSSVVRPSGGESFFRASRVLGRGVGGTSLYHAEAARLRRATSVGNVHGFGDPIVI